MWTRSGKQVTLTGGAFTVGDIAYNLSAIPRWAGSTVQPWSVAQHSLAMMWMAQRILALDFTSVGVHAQLATPDHPQGKPRTCPGLITTGTSTELHALWHDAHEAATEDVPPPFKTDEQRAMQKALDTRIYRDTLGVGEPLPDTVATVAWLDSLCVSAEAHRLMHPDVAPNFTEPDPLALAAIEHYIDMTVHNQRRAFCRWTYQLQRELTHGA